LLKSKKSSIRALDLGIDKTWKDFAKASSRIPYLGVAAHAEWADQNPALVKKLFATYKAAAEWIDKHPDEAAKLIFPKSPAADQNDIASLIRAKDRLGLSLSRLRSVYSDNLIEVTEWCMSLDPLSRPQSVFALQKELARETERRYTKLSFSERLKLQLENIKTGAKA